MINCVNQGGISMAESYISELGDSLSHGVANTNGDRVKIIAPKLYNDGNGNHPSIATALSGKAASNHTHTTSIASDSSSGTVVTLAHDTQYKLTAGGTSVLFKTPADSNTDTKVTQTVDTSNNAFPLLAKNTTATATITDTARFASTVTVNPSIGGITANRFTGALYNSKAYMQEASQTKSGIYLIIGSYTFTASKITPTSGDPFPRAYDNKDITFTMNSRHSGSGICVVSTQINGDNPTETSMTGVVRMYANAGAASRTTSPIYLYRSYTPNASTYTPSWTLTLVVSISDFNIFTINNVLERNGWTIKSGTIAAYDSDPSNYVTEANLGTLGTRIATATFVADTDTKVTQTADNSSTGTGFEVLFSATADNTTRTEASRKSSKLTFQPSTGTLTATKFSGPLTGNVTGNCSGSSGSCTGNAATASAAQSGSALETAINGKSPTSHTHTVKINGAEKTIAATGGTAVNLGTYTEFAHVSDTAVIGNNSPAADCKTYFVNNVSNGSCKVVYCKNGNEYTIIFAKQSSGNYGNIIKYGYADKYIYILRYKNSVWQSEDWEKISAGYADTAEKLSVTALDNTKNLNDYKGSSQGDILLYKWASTSVPTNAPESAASAVMQVINKLNTSYVEQFVYVAAMNGVYQRACNNGTWTSWRKVLFSDDVTSTYSSTGTAPVNGTAVAAAIGNLDSEKTSTDGTNVQVKVTEADGKISAVNITTDTTANRNEGVYYVAGTTDYPAWVANHAYAVNDNAISGGKAYFCKTAHTSGTSFDSSKWTAIATPVIKGTITGVTALYTGLKIALKWPITGGSSSTYLNINSLGNVYIRRNDGNITTHIPANSVSFLAYDGTYWRWADYDSNTNNWVTTMGAYCDTAAGTQAKVATSTSTVYTAGESFLIRIVNANTYDGKITLNINSQGARDVWINGAVSSSSNKTLPAGEHWCHYDGSVFHIWTDGTAQFTKLKAGTFTGNVTGNASTATKATQDSDGNAINATYFKSSGNVTLVSGTATKIGTQNGTDVKLTLPTIPAAANNGALQIQLNGGTATSKFTANQSGNSTLAFSTGSTAGTFKVDTTEIAIAGFTKVESSSTNGKIKINGTDTTVYTHPTTEGNKHIPSGGSSGQFLGYDSAGTVKWVSNPNTDTKQRIVTSDSKTYLTGVTTAPTSSNQDLTGVANTNVYATAGQLHATTFDVNSKCTLQFNTTTNALDFVFA